MNKNIDMDIIIEKDYEDTTDSENMRLEKNIREIEIAKKSKLLNVSSTKYFQTSTNNIPYSIKFVENTP